MRIFTDSGFLRGEMGRSSPEEGDVFYAETSCYFGFAHRLLLFVLR